MGAIYRAFDTVMGREVAIKRLLPLEETNLNEESSHAVLEKEAAALARFQHPNIVTVYAFEQDEEGPFVVMELVDGEDLHQILKDGALSYEDFQDVSRQCLEPLVEAWENNLLHRDIKPGNIMLTMTLTGKFLVKILDFGLAKFSQQPSTQTLDQSGSFLGSIDYIAPEQLELRPLDQRTDLYSLGCVLYYSLSQVPPFTGGNPAETTRNHLKHTCKPISELRSDVPEPVANWLMRMISRRPEDRPANALEALEELQAALEGVSVVTAVDGGGSAAVSLDHSDVVHLPPDESAPVAPPPSGAIEGSQAASNPEPPATGSASGPVSGPVSEPVSGPVSEPVPSRTSRQPILPDPRTGEIRSAGTRPVSSSRTSAVRAQRTGPRKPSLRSTSSESETPWFRKPLVLGGAGALLLLLVLIALFPGGGSDSDSGTIGESGSTDAGEESSATLPDLPMPDQLTLPPDAAPAPALPVTEGLVARFHGGTGMMGRDYVATPAPGESVAAWFNLMAAPNQARGKSLVRDAGDRKGQYLPRMVRLGPGDLAGLGGVFRGASMNNQSALITNPQAFRISKGISVVLVGRLYAGTERFIRINPPQWDGRYLHLSLNHAGDVAGGCKFVEGAAEARVGIRWRHENPGIVSFVMDPGAGEQRLTVEDVPGVPARTKTGQLPEGEMPVWTKVAIGKRGFGDGFEEDFQNVLFELLVYDRALSLSEVDEMHESLWNRYFQQ